MKKAVFYVAALFLGGCASQVTEGPVDRYGRHTNHCDGLVNTSKRKYVIEPRHAPIQTKDVPSGQSSLKHDTADQPLFVR